MGDVVPRSPAQPLAEHLNHRMHDRRLQEVPGISGLYYFPDFLDSDTQREVVRCIDDSGEHWCEDLERRVQHYGWRYDYRARTTGEYLGPLPDWAEKIAGDLCAETGLFEEVPDQVIVNEYDPARGQQGIALHADRDCFGPTVATVSLGDDWEMKLRPMQGTQKEDRRIMLVRGSALMMTGEARDRWMHGIDKRKTEEGGRRKRCRRLSLTFRTMLSRPSELHPPQTARRRDDSHHHSA